MGQEDRLDLCRFERKAPVFALEIGHIRVEKTAIHQEQTTPGFKEVTGAGDLVGRAIECEHGRLSDPCLGASWRAEQQTGAECSHLTEEGAAVHYGWPFGMAWGNVILTPGITGFLFSNNDGFGFFPALAILP